MSSLIGLGMFSPAAAPLLAAEPSGMPADKARDDALGFRLMPGFEATIFADGIRNARHIAVDADGDVYVMLRRPRDGTGAVALRDSDGDGMADEEVAFSGRTGTGIAIHRGYLYIGSNTDVVRHRLEAEDLVPSGEAEVIVTGFPQQRQHAAKPMTFDNAGNLYVTVGAPSNACQEQMRTPGSPGQDPCPQLERQAGIWQFSATGTDQVHGTDGLRYATGVRHAVALDWDSATDALYFVQHGRDQLHSLYPDIYTQEDNAELPAEEFHKAGAAGMDFGWPETYYDPIEGTRRIAPEYGGDGERSAQEGAYPDPLIAFPAHWAPNDLLFYSGDQFPERFRNGAFIAFHGSWNRAPLPQQGYRVAFVPFKDGVASTEWVNFADQFGGAGELTSPSDAEFRPMALAQGPDGALYIGDSAKGRIWKITYQGE